MICRCSCKLHLGWVHESSHVFSDNIVEQTYSHMLDKEKGGPKDEFKDQFYIQIEDDIKEFKIIDNAVKREQEGIRLINEAGGVLEDY